MSDAFVYTLIFCDGVDASRRSIRNLRKDDANDSPTENGEKSSENDYPKAFLPSAPYAASAISLNTLLFDRYIFIDSSGSCEDAIEP